MRPEIFLHLGAILLAVSASFAPRASAPLARAGTPPLKADPFGTVGLDFARTTTNERFPWKKEIVTTVFWVGELPTGNNPVPNKSSSWDKNWTQSYGGYDNPTAGHRNGYLPANFTPQQNPFYCALPYNDKASTGHRSEAPTVVPWFKEAYQGPAMSTCKGRWLAIHKGNKTAYAQWEDAGPFRTDHWQYVFGNERPKPNLNKGAGLDVSPAVRDYLGLKETDVTDWKFVDFSEVPQGPWATHGSNNPFVINRGKRSGGALVEAPKIPASANR